MTMPAWNLLVVVTILLLEETALGDPVAQRAQSFTPRSPDTSLLLLNEPEAPAILSHATVPSHPRDDVAALHQPTAQTPLDAGGADKTGTHMGAVMPLTLARIVVVTKNPTLARVERERTL